MSAFIHLIRDTRAMAYGCARAMFGFCGFNQKEFQERESPVGSPLGFRIQIRPFGLIFIVATALTPDELQRLHYHGELA